MTNRIDLAREWARRGYRHIAEIGVADGRYSLTLCQAIPDIVLTCVDPWRPYAGNTRGGPAAQHDRNYALARQRLAPYVVTFHRLPSLEAAPLVPNGSLDAVYIDGNHAYAYVRDDLAAWAPKVRPGGIVAGHDYYPFARAGVIQAVDEYAAAHGLPLQVIGEVRKHRRDDDQPTWWWEQPGA